MTSNLPPVPDRSGSSAGDQMDQIDGINAAAGHALEDPVLRDIVRRQLAGEISGDEARELGRQHLEQR